MNYQIDHIRELEAESIYVMREVAAQFEKPVLMFSGGKDSITMARLAQKAFWPGNIPFPFLPLYSGCPTYIGCPKPWQAPRQPRGSE